MDDLRANVQWVEYAPGLSDGVVVALYGSTPLTASITGGKIAADYCPLPTGEPSHVFFMPFAPGEGREDGDWDMVP